MKLNKNHENSLNYSFLRKWKSKVNSECAQRIGKKILSVRGFNFKIPPYNSGSAGNLSASVFLKCAN